jgi:hypothetical protein
MSQLCVLRICFICFDDFRTPVLRLLWKPPSTRLNIDLLHSENVLKTLREDHFSFEFVDENHQNCSAFSTFIREREG